MHNIAYRRFWREAGWVLLRGATSHDLLAFAEEGTCSRDRISPCPSAASGVLSVMCAHAGIGDGTVCGGIFCGHRSVEAWRQR